MTQDVVTVRRLAHLGFRPTAEVKPYRFGSVVSETVVLEKRLANTSWEPTVA